MNRAQVYPPEFCSAICQGIKEQKLNDAHGMCMIESIEGGHINQNMIGSRRSDAELHGRDETEFEEFIAFDVSGKDLRPHLVR